MDNSSVFQTSNKSPFQYAPLDILALIFDRCIYYFTAAAIPRLDIRHAPLNVSHVCSHWRQASLSTPQLWRALYIRENVNLHLLEESYKRSASTTLDIFVHLSWTHKGETVIRRGILEFVQNVIFQEQHRWRRVYLAIPMCHVLKSLLQTTGAVIHGLRNLESLTLRVSDREVWSNFPEVQEFGIDLSASLAIEKLRLSGTEISVLHKKLPRFTLLRKLQLRLNQLVSFDTYLNLLNSSPRLEQLVIKIHADTSDHDALSTIVPDGPLPNVRLPHLRDFQLNSSGRYFSLPAALLNVIDAPNLKDLLLHDSSYASFNDDPSGLQSALNGLLQRTSTLVSLTIRLKMDEDSFIHMLDRLPVVERLRVNLEPLSWETISALDTTLSSSSSTSVRVPCLQELTIYCVRSTTDTLLNMLLSRTYVDGDGPKPFRSLKKVSIPRWYGIPRADQEYSEKLKTLYSRGLIIADHDY